MVEQERSQSQEAGKAGEARPEESPAQEQPQQPAPAGNGQSTAGQAAGGPATSGPAAAGEPSADRTGEGAAPDPVAELKLALAATQEKTLRLQAEFDNYRKRSHKEQHEVLKYAQLPLLRDLAGVMDNLERAIGHARDSQQSEVRTLAQGLDMVVKQLDGVFERFAMQRIAAQGQPFDPRKHEAMKVVETDGVPENRVLEEFQPGYSLHDRVVRPTMVAVSRKPPAAEAAPEGAPPAGET
jgi:molecular chaperone GrpE